MSDEWTSNEAKEFLSIVRGEAEKVYRDQSEKKSGVYACLAVVSVISEAGDIFVRLLSSPDDGSQDFVVRNQSGSILEVGDSVWLHYWSDYTNVYIAVRNMGDTASEVTADSVGAISYAEAQALSTAQKTQALTNIGASPLSHVSRHAIDGADSLNAMPYNSISSNLLINGGFDIWQRGTSFTATGYAVDRWKLTLGTSMAITATQQSFTVGQTDVPGEPTCYIQFAISNAGSADGAFEQRIESVRVGAGGNISYSFYAKCSATTYAANVKLVQNFGTGGSSDVSTAAQNITLTTTWQKFSGTFTLGSIAGKTVGANNYLSLKIALPTSSGIKTLAYSNAQVNYGSYVLPYTQRDYAGELRLCQRYYQILSSIGSSLVPSTAMILLRHSVYPVEMRVSPSIVINSQPGLGGSDANIDGYGIGNISLSGATIAASSRSLQSITKTGAFVTTAFYTGSAKLDAEL